MKSKLKEYLDQLNEMIESLPQESKAILAFSEAWKTLEDYDENNKLLKIRSLLEQFVNSGVIENNHPIGTLINKVLIMLAKSMPRNDMTDEEFPSWVCPISFNVASDCTPIALTSGYLYDQEALFRWFRQSQQFTDPQTRQELSSFDRNRVIKREQGLATIQEMKTAYESKARELLAEQYQRLSQPSYDEIKKLFYTITNHLTSSAFNPLIETLEKKLLDLIESEGIAQETQKYTEYAQPIANFSRLDLSGLYFYKNRLVDMDLRGANLSNCVFLGGNFTSQCMHADLSGANLKNVQFLNLPGQGICIKTTNFSHANLKNANFTGVGNWGEVNLDQADLRGAFLYNKKGIKVTGEALKTYLKKHGADGVETAVFTKEKNAETMPSPSTGPSSSASPSTSTGASSSLANQPRLSVMPRGLLFEQPRPNVGTSSAPAHYQQHQSREDTHPRHCCLTS